MLNSVRELFSKRVGKYHEPALETVEGSYRFDVSGEGCWRAEVHRGDVEITESNAPAECVIRGTPDEIANIAEGHQNLLTAFMQGRLQIEGDVALAMKFHGFIRTRQMERGQPS